jgi:hypothetical protein
MVNLSIILDLFLREQKGATGPAFLLQQQTLLDAAINFFTIS